MMRDRSFGESTNLMPLIVVQSTLGFSKLNIEVPESQSSYDGTRHSKFTFPKMSIGDRFTYRSQTFEVIRYDFDIDYGFAHGENSHPMMSPATCTYTPRVVVLVREVEAPNYFHYLDE